MEGRKPIRLCIWATVRSNVNTALQVFVNMSSNCMAINKPYSLAYFYGEERKDDRFDKSIKPNATYRYVKEYLEQDFKGQDVVVKDVAYYLQGHVVEGMPAGYKHLILIRDPQLVVPSLYTKPAYGSVGFNPDEARYEEVNELYDTLERETGVAPVVLDADQLLKNPDTILRRVCEQLQIPFCDEMINWRPKTSDILDNMIHLGGHTKEMFDKHASRGATGLRTVDRKSKNNVDLSTLPEEVTEAVEKAKPLYDRLYKLSVKAD